MQIKTNQGLMILIDGTSSSGKTSTCKILKPKLSNAIQYITMDDFINNVFEEFKKNQITESELLPKCNYQTYLMYNHIKDLVNQNKTVVCETTLTCLEDDKCTGKWFSVLKNVPGLLILIYCPLRDLAERVKSRNKNALSENNHENTRLIHVVLNQFGVMFKANENNNEPYIDSLSRQDCEFAFDLLKDEFRGDNKKFEAFKIEILKKLNLIDNNRVYISSRLAYDYVVDTVKFSSEECAQKIMDFLNLKITPQAILKNCIYTGIINSF